MISRHLLFAVGVLAFCLSGSAFGENFEKSRTYVAPDKIFVPPGYDNTDVNVEIALMGTLPSNCFELAGNPEVDRSRLEEGVIVVRQRVIYRSKLICTQASESYLQVANLGAELPAGTYKIVVESNQKPEDPVTASLTIAETESEDVDNFHYLNVKDAFLTKRGVKATEALAENPEEKIKRFLNIRGEHRNACVSLRDVEIKVFEKENIIQVLPIIDVAQDSLCNRKVAEVHFSGELPKLPEGTYLVHIRSAFGKSRNLIVEF